MSSLAELAPGWEDKIPGYQSTLLGKPVWIRNRPGTPKAREDCQPFTFTLVDPETVGYRRTDTIERQIKLLPQLEAAMAGKKPRKSTRGFGCRISADLQRRLYNEAMGR